MGVAYTFNVFRRLTGEQAAIACDWKPGYVMRKNLDYGLLHAMNAFVKVVDTGAFSAAAGQMAS
jgi:hypothetical protein